MNEMDEIVLNEFDCKLLTFGKKLGIVGEAKSGKSSLIRYILEESIPYNTYGIVITTNNEFYDFFPKDNIYKRYSVLLKGRCFNKNTFLVIDDYVCNEVQNKDIVKNIEEMIFISAQKSLPENIKFDYIVLTSIVKNIKEIYNRIFDETCNISYKDFLEIMTTCIEENDFFVIDTKLKIFYYC